MPAENKNRLSKMIISKKSHVIAIFYLVAGKFFKQSVFL